MATQQGWSEQTPAVRALIAGAMGGVRRAASRRRTKKPKRAAAKRGTRRVKSTGSKKRGKLKRLVKGSAAAKRYMAKIRKLRK